MDRLCILRDELAITARQNDTSAPVSPLRIKMCLSLKTNPHSAVLREARSRGFLAECISIAEVRWALRQGFRPQDIVLTGPGKLWQGQQRQGHSSNKITEFGTEAETDALIDTESGTFRAIFADSLCDLRTIVNQVRARGRLNETHGNTESQEIHMATDDENESEGTHRPDYKVGEKVLVYPASEVVGIRWTPLMPCSQAQHSRYISNFVL